MGMPWPLQFVAKLLQLILWLLWRAYKWTATQVTGQCELLRIVQQHPKGAARYQKIERSLTRSSVPAAQQLLLLTDTTDAEATTATAEAAASAKRAPSELRPLLAESLADAAGCVLRHRLLQGEAERLRRRQFCREEPQHRQLLLRLWRSLRPDDARTELVGDHWPDVGFQGNDPGTDFRGMGLLGLEQLAHFAGERTPQARSVYAQSQHPRHEFSFAIVGINLTQLVLQLLAEGRLRNHFYNAAPACSLCDLHDVYCCVFVRFAELWRRRRATVMQFGCVRDELRSLLLAECSDTGCCLTAAS